MAQTALYREIVPGFEISDKEIKAKIQADTNRRVKMKERYQILSDNWLSVADNKLSQMFAPDSYIDMKPYLDVSNNLAKRIFSEQSVVYKDDPTRTVTPKGQMKRYEEITTRCRLNRKMAALNFWVNGLNDMIMQTAVFGNRLDKNFLFPHEVIVFENEDDPTRIDALVIEDCYTDVDGNERRQYFFWSPTRHFAMDEDFRKLQILGNEGMENPYKEINVSKETFRPFIFVHKSERINSFWDTTSGTDVFEATKSLAIYNTFLSMMFPMQFKQLAVQMNIDPNSPAPKNNQLKNPLHVYMANGEIQVLDWQSALTQLVDVIDRKLFHVAGNYGISAENFKLTATATSGFARMIAKERLLEIREEQTKIYRSVEDDCFESIRDAVNLFSLGDQISDAAKFSIDFAEPKFPNDPLHELAVLEKKIELGIANIFDVVRAENPDIKNDQEAEEFISKNVEIRNRVQNRFGLGMGILKRAQEAQGGTSGEE